MKTLNINIKFTDITDKHPCWYVKLENNEKRVNVKWIIGVKKENKPKTEWILKASKLSNIDDDKFWNYLISHKFAIELIKIFKNGNVGSQTITDWLKNNKIQYSNGDL